MRGPIVSVNKTGVFTVLFILICILIFSTVNFRHSTGVVERLKETAKETANNICNNDRPVFGKPSFRTLFEAVHHPVSAPAYNDAFGKVFEVKEDAPWWKEPLKNQILILDIDTRVPQGPNELWNEGRLNWEELKGGGDGGMVSASFMNHFLYGKSYFNQTARALYGSS